MTKLPTTSADFASHSSSPEIGGDLLLRALETAPAIVYVMAETPEGWRPVWASPNVAAKLGYPLEEILSPTWWVDHLYPADREKVLRELEPFRRGERDRHSHRYRFQRADGSVLWIRDELRRIVDSDGDSLVVGSWMDITQEVEQEDQFRILFETSPHGVAVHQDGRVVMANPAAARLVGAADPDELIGQPIQRFIHPDIWPDVVARIQRMLAGEEGLYPVEDRYVRLDGREVPVEVIARPFTYRGRPAVQVIARDLTREKQARQELERQIAATRQMLDTTLDGFILADTQGRILEVNPAYCQMVGYAADELVGGSIFEREAALTPEQIEARIAEMVQAGRARFQTRHWHRDGHAVDLDVSITILDGDDGPLVAAFVRDITEQLRAQKALEEHRLHLESLVAERTHELEELNQALTNLLEDLQAANQRAEQALRELRAANQELEGFTYTVTHDLRAPLRAMSGFAQALLEDYGPALDATGQMFARRIVHAAQRMDELIQDLLTYSRLGRMELHLSRVDVDAELARVLADLKPTIQEQEAHIQVVTPLPMVWGNSTLVRQILANLVSNGLKFVAPGIRPRLRIGAEQRGNRVRLWVEDNGIGVPPAYQEKIWHIFERLHGIESYPGTGVGLAIVRRAAERMGGRVGVVSEEGRGSRFWVELPAAP